MRLQFLDNPTPAELQLAMQLLWNDRVERTEERAGLFFEFCARGWVDSAGSKDHRITHYALVPGVRAVWAQDSRLAKDLYTELAKLDAATPDNYQHLIPWKVLVCNRVVKLRAAPFGQPREPVYCGKKPPRSEVQHGLEVNQLGEKKLSIFWHCKNPKCRREMHMLINLEDIRQQLLRPAMGTVQALLDVARQVERMNGFRG